MSITLSPNMNLPVPGVGTEAGPAYATDINNCLSLIDSHNHTSGNGVQLTPSALNINADIPLNNNNLTLTRTVRFQIQSATPGASADLACLYSQGVDLYFIDGLGNNVRITQSGAVAGSPGSIANLTSPASATYVSGSQTFVWQSDASTPANMDCGALVLRNILASSKGLTLSPPSAMGADYGLTLPSLPASQKFMTLDASGNIAAPWAVDNSTIEVAANTVQVKDGGITKPKLAALGQQLSTSSGASAGTGNTTFTNVTNLVVTITTTGRPVMLMVVPDGSASPAIIGGINNGGGSTVNFEYNFTRGGSQIAVSAFSGRTTDIMEMAPGILTYVDTPAAGTYVYRVQSRWAGGTGIASGFTEVDNVKLLAFEL